MPWEDTTNHPYSIKCYIHRKMISYKHLIPQSQHGGHYSHLQLINQQQPCCLATYSLLEGGKYQKARWPKRASTCTLLQLTLGCISVIYQNLVHGLRVLFCQLQRSWWLVGGMKRMSEQYTKENWDWNHSYTNPIFFTIQLIVKLQRENYWKLSTVFTFKLYHFKTFYDYTTLHNISMLLTHMMTL